MENCVICDKKFSNLNVHLRKKHDLSRLDYDNYTATKNNSDEREKLELDDNGDFIVEEVNAENIITEKINEEDVELGKEEVIDTVTTTDKAKEDTTGKAKEEIKPTKKDGTVTHKELISSIFDNVKESDPDRPLSVFCKEFDITESELINVVAKYTNEGEIPICEIIKNQEKVGHKKAKELAGPPSVKTTNAHVSQSLIEDFGYTCVNVKGAYGMVPKTYFLQKT